MKYEYVVAEVVNKPQALRDAKEILSHEGLLIEVKELGRNEYSVCVCDITQKSAHRDKFLSSCVTKEVLNTQALTELILTAAISHLKSQAYMLTMLIDRITETQSRDTWTEEMNELYREWFLTSKRTHLYRYGTTIK